MANDRRTELEKWNQYKYCEVLGIKDTDIDRNWENNYVDIVIETSDDEIEIIEEEKEIEQLEKDVEYIEHPEKKYPDRIEKKYYYDRDKMGDKINELVRELNKIKKERK